MARYIALLLVLSTPGVIFTEAQCRAACAVDRPNVPLKQTRCHHHRPSSQQCMHKQAPTWIRAASPATVPLLATGREVASSDIPVPDRACGTVTFTACAQPPGPPPQTALRI